MPSIPPNSPCLIFSWLCPICGGFARLLVSSYLAGEASTVSANKTVLRQIEMLPLRPARLANEEFCKPPRLRGCSFRVMHYSFWSYVQVGLNGPKLDHESQRKRDAGIKFLMSICSRGSSSNRAIKNRLRSAQTTWPKCQCEG